MSGVVHPKDYFLINEIAKFKESNPEIRLGFAAITGSDTYGFRSTDSDYDIRGVFYYNTTDQLKLFNSKKSNFDYTIQNESDIVSQTTSRTNNEFGAIVKVEFRKYDFVFTEVKNFLVNLTRMNCTTLEQLFSNMLIYSDPYFVKLKNIIGNNLASRGIYDSYYGMANFNYKHYIESDRKATVKKWLYVIRAYLSGIYALENGKIQQDTNELIKESSALNGNHQKLITNLIQLKQKNKEDNLIEDVTDYKSLKDYLLELRNILDTALIQAFVDCKLLEQPTEILKEYLDYWIVDLRSSF